MLYDMLENFTNKSGSSNALLYMGKSFTYDELFDGISEAAKRLSLLLNPGDVATVCMPNTPECLYCFYALNKIGAVAHMVHPLAPLNQLKKFMAAANSKLLITLSINLEKYAPLGERYKIVYIHPARSLGAFARFVFDIKNKPYTGGTVGMIGYDRLPEGEDRRVMRADNSTGVYLHSGGTGGEPKIIELSDGAINSLASRGLEALQTDDAHGVHMLAALPISHGFGLSMCIHTILTHGGVCVLMPKFDPKASVKLIKKNRLHILVGVPALFRALLARPEFYGDGLKNLYVGFVGGDSAPPELLDEFNGRLIGAGARARLFEGYGLTETVNVCAVNTYANNRVGSLGRMLSGLEAKVIDPETQEVLPLGAESKGEIVVCGNTLMNGYMKNPELTAEAFIAIDGRRYVRTGDFGYIDADGYLYFVQRLKRIIKIAGISIYPKEIEASATELDGVTDACAVEYKDGGGKTKIALFYVGREYDAARVREKIELDLSRYAVPTLVLNIDRIPVTPLMKADTLALAARAQSICDGGSEATI